MALGFVSMSIGFRLFPECVVKARHNLACSFLTGSVNKMLDAVLQEIPASSLAIHCHDTYGQALANILASIEVSSFQTYFLLHRLFLEDS